MKNRFSLLRIILPFLRREKRLYLVAIALFPPSIFLPLVLPRLVQETIDHRLTGGVDRALLEILGLFLTLIVAEFGIRTGFFIVLQRIGLRIMLNLRRKLFDHLIGLPLGFFRKTPKGRIVARLTTDLEQIDQAFASGGLMFIADILSAVAIVIAMLMLSPRLALFSLAAMPFLLVVVAWLRVQMRETYRLVRSLLASINAFAQEAIGGHEAIRVLAARDRFEAKFHEESDAYQAVTLKANYFEAAFFSMIDFFGTLSIAALVWGASGESAVTAGVVIAMSQYVQQLFLPLRGLSNRIATFQQAFVALERVQALLEEPVESAGDAADEGRSDSSTPELACRKVGYSYVPGRPVLTDVEMEIAPGEHLALIGETGSGKSTLARLIAGFYRPESGAILWRGRDFSELSLEARRRLVALVPQEVFLFDSSISENIRMGWNLSDEKLAEVIDAVGLRELDDRFSGADAGLGEWGRRISEGEKQLIAAARVMAYNPALVILDEATSALDPLLDERIRAALRRALQGRAALIIAHRLSTLRTADRIAVMHEGRLLDIGSHDDLIERSEVYRKLHRLFQIENIGIERAAGAGASA